MYMYKFEFAEDYKNNPDNKEANQNVDDIVTKFIIVTVSHLVIILTLIGVYQSFFGLVTME